jgi:hypothetical protein
MRPRTRQRDASNAPHAVASVMVTLRSIQCSALAAASLATNLALAEPPVAVATAGVTTTDVDQAAESRVEPGIAGPTRANAFSREFRVHDFVRPLPTRGPLASAALPRQEDSFPDALQDLPFRDREPLINRLRTIQALPFVTLWDSRQATVYVGVNRDGEPGLHLRQKHDRDAGPLVGAKGTREARSSAEPATSARN